MPKPRKSNGTTARVPLRITDTTLRDAHQSLWATRMRTADILKIIETIDAVGYYSLEVWGGATFDVCLRFLREDPWERLRAIKAKATHTPLQMLLRGQNVLGYKNYPDDVLERFVALAVKNGVDIFRIFDALNDTRNLEKAIQAVKKYGGHAQGTISYTVSPVHTVEAYVKVAKDQIAMGIDSLCIKDMAGILSPIAAERLISALVKETKIPIQVHSHATSGMAVASYVEAVRAGAGAIDCAISPMSGFSSQPPVETMLAIFDETSYSAKLDLEAIRKVCRYFLELTPQRQQTHQQVQNIIDPEVLLHHIPGGMISNLRSQLAQQNALDKIDQVFEELPRVRADLGYPPLVTPTSQIIGIQAVMNVLAGQRYELVSQEVKDYVRGLYGRPPAPINPEVQHKILGSEKVMDGRPADRLEPGLPSATQGVDPKLITQEEDILSYCLFPEVALGYFRWRAKPADQRDPIPADEELRKHQPPVEEPPPAAPKPFLAPADYEALHGLLDKVHQFGLSELMIKRDDTTMILRADGITSHDSKPAEPAAPADAKPKTETPKAKPAEAKTVDAKAAAPKAPAAAAAKPAAASPAGPTVNAPLSGTFYISSGPGKPPICQVGDVLKAGDTICIVEAMKLFNQIKAPCNLKVVRFLVEHGKPVKKDEPMVVYEKA
jgi:oxaloacetate decarboxylase alpha subunit